MAVGGGNVKGTPAPSEWYRHQALVSAGETNDPQGLYAGAVVTNAESAKSTFPVAGCTRARVRIKTSGAGSLRGHFMRPDGKTAYTDTAGEPTAVAVVGGTETHIDFDVFGEAWAQADFLPSADGTVTYIDVMRI